MYVMGEKVGHSVLPIKRPGISWNKGQVLPIDFLNTVDRTQLASVISTKTPTKHEVGINYII